MKTTPTLLSQADKLTETDKLSQAAARRLYFLLEGKYPTRRGKRLLNTILTGNIPADPFNLHLLMLVAAGIACIRVRATAADDLQAMLQKKGSRASQARTAKRLDRALRLLMRLIRAGCEKRGEL